MYRKRFKDFSAGRDYERMHSSGSEIVAEIEELKKERMKLSDERISQNRKLRSEARLEARLENIERAIRSSGVCQFPPLPSLERDGERDLIVCLSDLHIGAEYSSISGKYSSEIAKERLATYLQKVLEIGRTHRAQNCYVVLLGDLISGSIHADLTATNRENVIEQVICASSLVEQFVYGLCSEFETVFLSSVVGNHSRLGKKEDALKDERLDLFIPWHVETALSHIKNFIPEKHRLDTSLSEIQVRGLSYLLVHGDYDAFSKNGATSLMLMLGYKPYAVIYGHYHQCAFDDAGGIKLIRSGCLGGSGDNYTVSKRLYGRPSQTVCVCGPDGVEALYPVEFHEKGDAFIWQD